MKKLFFLIAFSCAALLMQNPGHLYAASFQQEAPWGRIIAVYTEEASAAHLSFALEAVKYYSALAEAGNFVFESCLMKDMSYEKLKEFDMVMMLNAVPKEEAQRKAVERFVEEGGAWVGYHAAGLNTAQTQWPWFLQFMGGGLFSANNLPPQPAKVVIDLPNHPVTRGLLPEFMVVAGEWHQRSPSPRENPKVKVFATVSPDNYPLGLTRKITGGDTPIIWSNTQYRMVYMDMGHDGSEFKDPSQARLYVNVLQWLSSMK